MQGPSDLGIPPPFPFCEAWGNVPENSTRWLTPSFRIGAAHQSPLASFPSNHPPQHSNPLPQSFTPPHDNVTLAELAGPIDAGYESSEYEYGFELNEEWAEHFARRQLERQKRTTAKTRSKRPKLKRPIQTASVDTDNPLTYELTVGQLSGKKLVLSSTRVDAMERRLERAFLNDFSNPVTVCLFNA